MANFSESVPASDQGAVDNAAGASGQPDSGGSHSSGHVSYTAPPMNLPAFPNIAAGTGLSMKSSGVTSVAAGVSSDHATATKGLNQLDSAGPLAQLVAAGWTQSNNMANNSVNAYYAISAFTARLVVALDEVTNALHEAVKKVNDADEIAAQDAKGVNNTLEN
jgi:hypothetical protein